MIKPLAANQAYPRDRLQGGTYSGVGSALPPNPYNNRQPARPMTAMGGSTLPPTGATTPQLGPVPGSQARPKPPPQAALPPTALPPTALPPTALPPTAPPQTVMPPTAQQQAAQSQAGQPPTRERPRVTPQKKLLSRAEQNLIAAIGFREDSEEGRKSARRAKRKPQRRDREDLGGFVDMVRQAMQA